MASLLGGLWFPKSSQAPGWNLEPEACALTGCSQNLLTTRFEGFFAECPQVKEGSAHSRAAALPLGRLAGSIPLPVYASRARHG